ncbi:MAG: peptidoglycan-associated lipoprotein Pal [Gemmatimonadaceae bacterium]
MNRTTRVAPLVIAGMVAALTACPRRQPPVTPAPVNQDSIDAANRERARQDSIAAADRARQDSLAALERARQDSLAAAQGALTATRNAVTAPVYFDFDQSELTDAARTTLDAKVPVLSANAGLRIRVAGNTDSRGSDEYNLALGQRRAAAAKRYLTQHGIDGSRIDVISYGEERPAAQGDDESAWSQNRRAEFEITAGGDNIVPAARQ